MAIYALALPRANHQLGSLLLQFIIDEIWVDQLTQTWETDSLVSMIDEPMRAYAH